MAKRRFDSLQRRAHQGQRSTVSPESIPQLQETVQDILAAAAIAGDGITITYDDANGTLTIASDVDLSGYYTAAQVDDRLADKADVSHHHDADYAAAGHNHDADYAAAGHNHDGVYSAAGHNHDADYAAAGHNHDSIVNGSGNLLEVYDIESGRINVYCRAVLALRCEYHDGVTQVMVGGGHADWPKYSWTNDQTYGLGWDITGTGDLFLRAGAARLSINEAAGTVATTGASLTLASLAQGGATDGQVLTWDDATTAWIPADAGGGGGGYTDGDTIRAADGTDAVPGLGFVNVAGTGFAAKDPGYYQLYGYVGEERWLDVYASGAGVLTGIVIGDGAAQISLNGPVDYDTLGSDPDAYPRFQIYGKDVSGSAEGFVMDEAGNVTQISPHPASELMERHAQDDAVPWAYASHNKYTGETVTADILGAIRLIQQLADQVVALGGDLAGLPTDLLRTSREAPSADWDADQAAAEAAAQARGETYTKKEPPKYLADRLARHGIRQSTQ